MNEICRFELILKLPEDIKLSQSTGSIFHGVLMECVSKEFGEIVHQNGVRPYSQYVYWDKMDGVFKWIINTLTHMATEEISSAILKIPSEIRLKQKSFNVGVISKECTKSTTYDELCKIHLINDVNPKSIQYTFLTSCAFKNNDTYVIYPDSRLIFKSLLKRWNTFTTAEVIDDPFLAEVLSNNTWVKNYNLRMNPFALEGIRIPAFRGEYFIGLRNQIIMNKISELLAVYAEYAGIGIKTALGMGAVKTNIISKFSEV